MKTRATMAATTLLAVAALGGLTSVPASASETEEGFAIYTLPNVTDTNNFYAYAVQDGMLAQKVFPQADLSAEQFNIVKQSEAKLFAARWTIPADGATGPVSFGEAGCLTAPAVIDEGELLRVLPCSPGAPEQQWEHTDDRILWTGTEGLFPEERWTLMMGDTGVFGSPPFAKLAAIDPDDPGYRFPLAATTSHPVVVNTPTAGTVVGANPVTFAGTGEPLATVDAVLATDTIASVPVSKDGTWTFDTSLSLAAGSHVISFTQDINGEQRFTSVDLVAEASPDPIPKPEPEPAPVPDPEPAPEPGKDSNPQPDTSMGADKIDPQVPSSAGDESLAKTGGTPPAFAATAAIIALLSGAALALFRRPNVAV